MDELREILDIIYEETGKSVGYKALLEAIEILESKEK